MILRLWQRLIGDLFDRLYVIGRRYAVYDQTVFFEQFPTPELRSTGFDWSLYQLMVSDQPRNEAYARDIRELVPGRSVLEIGPGASAVLTMMAAEAGAESVLALEANDWAVQEARRRVRPYGDRVQVVSGHSERVGPEIGPPRHFDVLLLECYHSVASQEDVVETVEDLRRRGFTFGSVISRGFTTYVAPAVSPRSAPMTVLERVAMGWPPGRRAADRAMAERRSTLHGDMPAFAAQRLAPAQRWQSCDFETDNQLHTEPTLRFEVDDVADVAGLQFFNRFDFHGGALDTGRVATHWGIYFVPLARAETTAEGPGQLLLHSRHPDSAQPAVVELQTELAGVAGAPIRL